MPLDLTVPGRKVTPSCDQCGKALAMTRWAPIRARLEVEIRPVLNLWTILTGDRYKQRYCSAQCAALAILDTYGETFPAIERSGEREI